MSSDQAPRQVVLVTVLLLLGTFAAGIGGGVGLCRWLFAPPLTTPQPHGRPLPGPIGELDLRVDQQQRARAIQERYRPEFESVIRETFPRVRAISDQLDQELRAVLTPEQQRQFDQAKARRPPLGNLAGSQPAPGPAPAPAPGPGPAPALAPAVPRLAPSSQPVAPASAPRQ